MISGMTTRPDTKGLQTIRGRVRRLRVNRRIVEAFRARCFARQRAEAEGRRVNPVALLAAIVFNAGIVMLLGHAPFARPNWSGHVTEEVAFEVSLKPLEVFLPEEQASPPPDILTSTTVPQPAGASATDVGPLSPTRPPVPEPRAVHVQPFSLLAPRVPVVMSQAHQSEPRFRVSQTPATDLPLAVETEAGVRDLLADYWENVRSRLSAHLHYPLVARQRQAEGTVVVEIALDEEGRLLKARPIREPQEPSLTRAVLATVRKASPFGRPKFLPEGVATNLVGTIAVRFDLVEARANGEEVEEESGGGSDSRPVAGF